MKLLCHRGYWKNKSEQNSIASLLRAMQAGHGIETDVRDCNGDLVIAHDMPLREEVSSLECLLDAYVKLERQPLLALNVKSDGLQNPLEKLLKEYEIDQYFMFDMSFPDTFGYLKKEMPIGVRLSEYEDGKHIIEHTRTIWLDAFDQEWYDRDMIISYLENDKRLCVVSPELHGRTHLPVWKLLSSIPISLTQDLYLCTDLVSQALEVFDVAQD